MTAALFNAAQVAERLQLSEVTVRRYAAMGWPHRRAPGGRLLRFSEDDVQAWLDRMAEGSVVPLRGTTERSRRLHERHRGGAGQPRQRPRPGHE
jgi:predicted DNA-binding transcriptional regulator AlpA